MREISGAGKRRSMRWMQWWAGLAGMYSLSGGTCPCCGGQACPTGMASALLAGGAIALLLRFWRRLIRRGADPNEEADKEAAEGVS